MPDAIYTPSFLLEDLVPFSGLPVPSTLKLPKSLAKKRMMRFYDVDFVSGREHQAETIAGNVLSPTVRGLLRISALVRCGL